MSEGETADQPSGGRRARRGRREAAPKLEQNPFRQVQNPLAYTNIVSEDELEQIHLSSIDVLENIGIEFLLPEARDLLKQAGCKVEGERVFFDGGLIEEKIKTIPSEFTMHARNPAKNIQIGGRNVAACAVASAPNVSDLEGGRRTGNHKDYCNLLRLGQSLNAVHLFGGYPVEPVDVHASIRHLVALRDVLTLSDKGFSAYALGYERITDAIEMARIARGISHEQLHREPSVFTVVNANSPLRYDIPMLIGTIEMAKAGQPSAITPFTLAGAMAPVTIAGALVQQNAEALAGLTLIQIVNPGAPAIYGGFTSNVDMKSGAPAFGTPEYMKAAMVGGQLCRRYGVPYRSSNVNASNTADAQGAWESVFSLWGAVMGGAHMLKHGAGWLEGGLCASYEKMVQDADMLQMIYAFLEPLEISLESLAVSTIGEVGPGGHFFGTDHTQARYKNAFFAPMVSDWRNFESWSEAGSPDAMTRSNVLCKELLAEYEEPELDAAIREELDAFVEKRIEEGGAPTDF